MSPGHRQARKELVSSRVAEAGPALPTEEVISAIDAVAPNARALSVLVRALEPGPGALFVGAPPVLGKLVAELRCRGSSEDGPRRRCRCRVNVLVGLVGSVP